MIKLKYKEGKHKGESFEGAIVYKNDGEWFCFYIPDQSRWMTARLDLFEPA